MAPTGWTAVTETMCFGEGLTKVINCLAVTGTTSWEAGKVMFYVTEDEERSHQRYLRDPETGPLTRRIQDSS